MTANRLLMYAFDVSLAVGIDIHMQRHGMAADRAVLDIILMRPCRKIDGDDDLLAARITDVCRLGIGDRSFAATLWAFLGHGCGKCSTSAQGR